jgi:hypothetical protein
MANPDEVRIVPNPPNMPGGPGGQWMGCPEVGPGSNVPPGLEYLTNLDQILVQQVVELLEAFTGWETNNKYAIKNMMGQQCYYAFEESGCCGKICCKNRRGFDMKIVDNTQREVIHAKRDFNCFATTCCCLACCGCTQHAIVVESPPGVVIGKINNKCSLWKQTFSISLGNEESGFNEVLEIVGPCCMNRGCFVCCDISFSVVSSATGDTVGHLKKQFSGMAKEVFTDADNFSVSFPRDLDVRAKAVMICSVFLIDFLFFEDNQTTDVKSQLH